MRHSNAADSRGSITVFAALAAVMLLGFAAIAIDVGYAISTRAQLQNVADAAAMSGARELARIYDGKGNFNYQKYTLTASDKAQIVTHLNSYAAKNDVGGSGISIPSGDVRFGKWNASTGDFEETSTGVDAVWLQSRRDSVANGPLNTLLSSVLGVDSFDLGARAATSAVSGTAAVPSGWGDIPVGISKAWFTNRDSPCGTDADIRFYPTGTTLGCAGWHVFTEPTANASTLRTILNGLKNGTYTPPATIAGETYFNFTGGTVASAFSDMHTLYNAKKWADGTWLVHIPVYDSNDCSNPNNKIKIIGFATARVYNVNPGTKTMDAKVECDIAAIGTAGGPYYGTGVAVGQKMLY